MDKELEVRLNDLLNELLLAQERGKHEDDGRTVSIRSEDVDKVISAAHKTAVTWEAIKIRQKDARGLFSP